MFVVGLTGGIASGKSTAGEFFESLGAAVIDADQTARDVVAPGSAGLEAVKSAFGKEIVNNDGAMDRQRMRKRVFANPDELRKLEHILHPLIGNALSNTVQTAFGPYCVLMVPLLIEKGLGRDLVDRIAVVDVDPAVQLQRLMQRDDSNEEEARNILAAQASREERLAAADDVIDNFGDLETLKLQVASLHERYMNMAGEYP